jgi:hypothetical protein
MFLFRALGQLKARGFAPGKLLKRGLRSQKHGLAYDRELKASGGNVIPGEKRGVFGGALG